MSRSLLVMFAAACLGCETHGYELRPILDPLVLPSGWVTVGLREGGLGSGFAAAPAPYTERIYAAPWSDGKVCEQLSEIVIQLHAAGVAKRDACTYEAWVRTGWRRQHWNRVWFDVMAPEEVGKHLTRAACERDRAWQEKNHDDLWSRIPRCYVPKGWSMVSIEASRVPAALVPRRFR